MSELPQVSIVVIGRNEERNLPTTFAAIQAMNYPRERIELIYVDSNSADRSVEIAKEHADVVLVEGHPLPSAARGRNRGLLAAKNEIVHFIDGDTKIDPEYLRKAVAVLENPMIQAVSGFIIESENHGWNRIMASAWNVPSGGYSTSTSAGGTYKRQPLLQVNGYDERVVLGEETELGERFLNYGFTIWSVNQPMGIHHYQMGSIADYLKWCIKNGRIRARNLFLPGQSIYFLKNRRLARSNTWINIIFITVIGLILKLGKAVYLLYAFLFYVLLFAIKYFIIKKIRSGRLLIYFLIMNITRPFSFYGQCAEYLKLVLKSDYRKAVAVDKMLLDEAKI